MPAGNPFAVASARSPRASRSRDFWLIAGSYFICGASTNGLIGTHLIPACVDHGLAEVVGAGLLAATGVFASSADRCRAGSATAWTIALLLAWYYGLRGLSLLYLPFAFDMSFYGLSLFAVFYGLDWIASVPPTVRLLTRVVGTERTGIMVAWITVIHQVGGAAAAYLGGVLRISFGTYLEAFFCRPVVLCGGADGAVDRRRTVPPANRNRHCYRPNSRGLDRARERRGSEAPLRPMLPRCENIGFVHRRSVLSAFIARACPLYPVSPRHTREQERAQSGMILERDQPAAIRSPSLLRLVPLGLGISVVPLDTSVNIAFPILPAASACRSR